MSYAVYHSHAEYMLSMTPEQRAIYERGYRDTELDDIVANDAMIRCAIDMCAQALAQRRVLLDLGFRDTHPLCMKLDSIARDWNEIMIVQRRLDEHLRKAPE